MNRYCLALVSLLLLSITSCKTVEYIHYLSQGKNLAQIQFLDGAEEVDLNALENISLKGFSVSDYHHPLVQHYVKGYRIHGDRTLDAILSRADFYLPAIKKIFQEKNIPEDLAYLPIIESGFNPKAESHAGAAGLWQFMYTTGILYKMKANYWYDDRRDFIKATEAAAYHLKYLYKRLDNWLLVLAAYNGGLGRVNGAIRRAKTENFWKLIDGGYLPKETSHYVPKFIASVMISKNYKSERNANEGGQESTLTANLKPYVVTDATDIGLLAKLSGMTIEQFKKLNPGLKSWATPPTVKHQIYIPSYLYEDFKNNFDAIPSSERITYRRYFVNIGDNLTSISKKYGVPVNPIAEINKFKSKNDITAGKYIVLPIQGLDKASSLDKERGNPAKVVKNNKTILKNTFLYVVQPRDTLYIIAKRFKVSLRSLMELNELSADSGNLYVREGRFLLIKL